MVYSESSVDASVASLDRLVHNRHCIVHVYQATSRLWYTSSCNDLFNVFLIQIRKQMTAIVQHGFDQS
jgi:hypothetical protein